MTYNEKKRWLCSYREMWSTIIRQQEEILVLRSRAEKITPTLSDMPSGGQSKGFTVLSDKIVDLERKLDCDILRCSEMSDEIKAAIYALESQQERDVLFMHYISEKEWEEIALKLGYSTRQVYRLHYQAICTLEKI